MARTDRIARIACTCVLALVVLAASLAVAPAPLRAGDDPVEPPVASADAGQGEAARDSLALCEGFADTVDTHRADCAAMGAALDALVDEHWRRLETMAGAPIPPELEAACLVRVEPAIAPLIACIDDDTVGHAMQRLRALHLRSQRAPAPATTSDAEPAAPAAN